MKTLLLMRHAKSSWKDDSLEDHERPLKKRGKKDAILIAKVMLKNDLYPDLILSLTSVRTQQTVQEITDKMDYKRKIVYLDDLYMGEPQDFIHSLKNLNDSYQTVLIVAHNPGLEAYLQIIDGEIEAMPTGALGYLVLVLDKWENISLETMGDLIGFWTPKEIRKKDK
jgi:phosphohistidine phosphatase